MRLNNNSKIVSDDDIIMSDGSVTLSDRLSSLRDDIDSLKTNVKWIYKYGGVGSGSGGGGGSNKTFSIFASLDGVLIKNSNIVLNGVNTYPLLIIINNPNGGKFNVTYSYTTKSATGSEITLTRTLILSIENSFRFLTNINLNTNSTISIVATDGNDTQLVSCQYIVTPYLFDVSLVDDSGNLYTTDGDTYEIFTETARNSGLNVKVDYIISISASVNYSAKFGNIDLLSGSITDLNGSLLFLIDKSNFTEDKSGLYSIVFNTQIIPDGLDLISNDLVINISLIPENLYCLITPDTGIIYTLQQDHDYYEYDPGYIQFNYRVYEGINNNRSYTVFVYVNGTSMFKDGLTVTERLQNSFKILASTAGLNNITIKINNYSATYYFYIKSQSNELDWFENSSQWKLHYYRVNSCTSLFLQYLNNTCILQTVNSSPIKISGIEPPLVSGSGNINTHIAIGLLYNYINTDGSVILSLYNDSDSPIMTVGQNSSTKGGVSVNCYILKQTDSNKDDITKYHLLLIFSKFVKKSGNDSYYDVSIYIDGRMEASFPSLSNSPLLVKQLLINNANVYINTIDVDYLPVSNVSENSDYDVYLYYLKYRSEIIVDQSEDFLSELNLREDLKKFKVGLNGRVIVDGATISNIAEKTSTPILVMTCLDNGTGEPFIDKLERNYGEDGSGIGNDFNFPVSILWSPGKLILRDVTIPESFTNAQFRAALQGSSTKLYRVKNFTLSIENTDQSETADVYLYSPNFDKNNPDSFLPETLFTLKADVVDSSHSNNTSCGKFVNTVCEKFSDSISDDSIFKPYIKNCLEGFPILLFMHIVTEDPDSGNKSDVYYYFGIYNFNLGREAYFNLGYKDLSVFGDTTTLNGNGEEFVFYKINNDDNVLREGLGVAEILGGSNYFDFSQYDPSILFLQNKDNDNTYMFGDLVHGSNFSEAELLLSILKFVKSVALGGGYLFDYIKKNRGSYKDGYSAEEVDSKGNKTGVSLNAVPDYTKQYRRRSDSGAWVYELSKEINPGTRNDLMNLCIPDVDNNRPSGLNFQSVSEYYTICMVLGLVDSVMKNLNIKTWTGNNLAGTTWVTAFYDMDTCLGINNSGGNISYFAFSDYWDGLSEKTQNGVDYPKNVRIYRDFSPSTLGSNGFDIPSSYLFAVAKYARLIFKDDLLYTIYYPQELYAKWRSNVVNNKTHEGILKNADYFIDNFYASNLGSINNLLVTYNYRSKYLSLGSNETSVAWITTDYEKFNGTRINYVRDWFNGRLHILDAYFNLNSSVSVPILYRDKNGNWKDLNLSSDPNVDDIVYDLKYNAANYSVASNQDVIILRDIFSSGSSSAGILLGKNVSFRVKCPKYSPLQIVRSNLVLANYIIGGDNYQLIKLTTTGVLGIKVGGSLLWTYLLDINWIEGGSLNGLYIGSDKLESISGSTNSFGSFTFDTPSVKSISLTSSGYTATLNLNGLDKYPNLNSVNLSGSKMSLAANSLNIKSVDVSNIKNRLARISITNCPNITSFSVSNSLILTLLWSQISGLYKVLKFDNNTNIANFNLSCIELGSSFTLIGDNAVESVTLQGFETVSIRNCPKLKTITILPYDNHNGKLIYTKDISITNCVNDLLCIKDSSNQIGSNTINLTNSTHLKNINFNGDVYIRKVYLPSNVTALPECFRGITNLETIDAKSLYIDHHVFYDCTNFRGRDSKGGFANLKVSLNTGSLLSAFHNTSVDINFVSNFYKTAIPSLNSVTNIQHMFSKTNIIFGQDDYINCITNGSFVSPINPSVLNKVTTASYLYWETGLNVHFKELYNFGSNSGCDYSYIMSGTTTYLTTDCFAYCINKMTRWGGNSGLGPELYQIPIDPTTGQIIPTTTIIKAKDIWNPSEVSPSKLLVINDFNIQNSYKLDLLDMFNSDWTSLTDLNECFLNCNSMNLGGLLYDLPKINRILTCFSLDSNSEDDIDLWEFIDWDRFVPRSYGGFITSEYRHTYNCFNFKRYISYDNYLNICNLYILNNKENLSNLFYNTRILNYTGELTFGNSGRKNNNAKYMRHTFDGATLGDGGPLNIDDNFFYNLPNIQDVRYCFANTSFAKPIPFDFFRKRYNSGLGITNIFVKVGEEYKEALLYEYKYGSSNDAKIWNFSHIFYNTSPYDSSAKQFNTSVVIPDNCVKNKDTSDQNVYMEYYTRTMDPETSEYIYRKHVIDHCTEITDMQNLHGGYSALYSLSNSKTFSNPSLEGANQNYLIIPPDFFYCAAVKHTEDSGDHGVTDYSYAFARNSEGSSSSRVGIIPKHIFKANRSGIVTGVFNNLVVIPRLISSDTSDGYTTNLYVLYPENYTEYSVLSNSFGALPIVLNDITDLNVINYSFVLFNESIPYSVSTLANAFLNNRSIQGIDFDSYGTTFRLNFACSYTNGLVILGFDMNKFTSLDMQDMLHTNLLNVLNGPIFKPTYYISNAKVANNDGRIVRAFGRNVGNHTSSMIYWPAANGDIRNKLFYGTPGDVTINTNKIDQSLYSLKYYKNTGVNIV